MGYPKKFNKGANKGSIGSIFVNAPKAASAKDKADIQKCVDFLKDKGAYLNISLKADRTDELPQNDKGYLSVYAFANRMDGEHSFYLSPPLDATGTTKPTSKQEVVEDADEEEVAPRPRSFQKTTAKVAVKKAKVEEEEDNSEGMPF